MLAAAVLLLNTIEAASTVLEKVVPPDWVMVTVPISVPTAPLIVTAPMVLIVRFELVPLAVPVTDERLKVFAIPVPTVSVTPSAKVAAPKVICPVEVPPTVELPDTVTPDVPKLMTPVPAAVIVPLIVLLLGAVAVTPPVKLIVSLPLPNVTLPVLEKVVAPAMVFEVPPNTTL